jgi:hypothetical protein
MMVMKWCIIITHFFATEMLFLWSLLYKQDQRLVCIAPSSGNSIRCHNNVLAWFTQCDKCYKLPFYHCESARP